MEKLIRIEGELDFKSLKEDFISYIDVSDLTLHSYSDAIKCFFNYMNDKGITRPTRDDLKAFREELKESKSTNTINSYLSALRVFFNYLEQRNIYTNITRDIKNVKTNKTPKRQVLSMEQVKGIYNSLVDKKERALISLLLTTGLRSVEVAKAKIEDIKIYNSEVVLWVQPKKHGTKDFYVKLSDIVLSNIKDYIGERTSGNIFVSTSNNNNGGGLTSTSIRSIVKSIFRRFGFDDDGFSTHSLRRTCATLMYQNGIDIYSIKQVLGHQSISTTQRYINQSSRDTNESEKKISDLIFN